MNSNTIQGNWDEIKGKIRAKWGKISEDDVESLKGNLTQLSGKIQSAYGYAKEKAEQEFSDFQQSLAGKANAKVEEVNQKIDNTKNKNEAKKF
jgi:uncharacterized protein YjbJ (UPF0337 family)